MRTRAARLAPLVFVAALFFSVAAMVVVRLNGGEIGSSDATGSAILAVSFSAVGAVIVLRRPENPVGWIFLFGGFCNSLNAFSWEYSRYALIETSGWRPLGTLFAWLSTWVFAPGFVAFPLTLLLFPTGRPPSPRWRPLLWLIAAGLALGVVPMAVAAWPIRGPGLVNDDLWADNAVVGGLAVTLQRAGVVVITLCILASIVSIGLRFRRAAGEERQQLKWLVYAGALTFIVLATASPASPFEMSGTGAVLLSVLALLSLPSIPVAVGIAILRYRLYDIDLVINRTLVYATLTAMLAAVYVACVVLLQYLFRTLAGEASQLAIVVSTLAIAALFNPLRRRTQGFIDRRFYRRKYDAAKTLEAFSAKLREETDLDRLGGDLVGVVQETLQPEHASLWLPQQEKIFPKRLP